MTDDERLILLIVLIIVAAITFLVEFKYIRGKRFRKAYGGNRLKKDQAFNSLHTTKAVRNRLKVDRIDTLKADYMIQKAQDALEAGDYDSCMDATAKAREEMLKSKREGNVMVDSSESSEIDTVVSAASSQPSTSGAARKLKVPTQQRDDLLLQARFELNAAKGDLDCYNGPADVRASASKFIEESEKHFNEKDYQKSLSDSFKARKLMSGEPLEPKEAPRKSAAVETIPPQSSSKNRCKECGSELEAGDTFCGACGDRVGEKKCISCGASLKGNDVFCRKCGAKN